MCFIEARGVLSVEGRVLNVNDWFGGRVHLSPPLRRDTAWVSTCQRSLPHGRGQWLYIYI